MRRVAVTGFGVVSPIGLGREAFWSALEEGVSGIGPITRFDCSTFEVRLAGEVKEAIDLPEEVGLVARTDPKVGFGFAAVREAMEQAGTVRLDEDCMLHLGVSLEAFNLEGLACSGDRLRAAGGLLGNPAQIPLDACTALVSRAFGRPGRALTNCSACAAGAQAIGHGFREVRAGRCRLAVCGGLDSMINILGIGGFQLLGALTTENELGEKACRPFDAARSGTVLGEGAGAVVLEPLEDARREGKEVLAEIRGYGSSLDACSLAAPDPEGDGAARAMLSALDDAGLPPESIGHINTHGTGTLLNDQVEAKAIRRVFRNVWPDIPVASNKSVTGHLIAAAGAVEFGSCLLTLDRSVIPPNPSLSRVGDGCELAHVTGKKAPFDGEYVLSNSFGFGGQNAVLIVRRFDG